MRYKLTGPNYFTWKRNLDNLLKSIGYSFVLKNLYLEIEGMSTEEEDLAINMWLLANFTIRLLHVDFPVRLSLKCV